MTANGALAGAVGAGISGGNVLQGAEFGAISSGLAAVGAPLVGPLADALAPVLDGAAATASTFIVQGFAGGLASVIEGSNFGSGFLAAGVGSLAGGSSDGQIDLGGLIASAVVGGAASVLGGGKFENGAITGAYAYVVATIAHGGPDAPSDQFAGPGASTAGCTESPAVCAGGIKDPLSPWFDYATATAAGWVAAEAGGVGRLLYTGGRLLYSLFSSTQGLPPDGLLPPGEGPFTVGPASRMSDPGQSLWDANGGEWRYFPGDEFRNPHWDYNPWSHSTDEWQNIPIDNLPTHR